MKKFMDEDFLLNSGAAAELYRAHAESLPVCDYHCHLNPADIAQDRGYENLTRLWLGEDHYKWRLMRAGGVPEEYITGSADDFAKFQKFAEILPAAAGNPVYHWAHLELKRYFGCDIPLGGGSAERVWNLANEKLRGLTARKIIGQSNVRVIVTTDDPADGLEWHEMIRNDTYFQTEVLPCFRPDLALSPEKPGYAAYLERLGEAAGMEIVSFDCLCRALEARAARFGAMGCRSSDHSLAYIPYRPAHGSGGIFKKAKDGKPLSEEEQETFKTTLLGFLGGMYARLGWVMQIHYGAARGVNTKQSAALGPDTGFDCIGPDGGGRKLAPFLDMLASDGCLPKTALYSLDPNDDAIIGSVAGCFENVRHGPAWWFNDSRDGVERHLRGLANCSLLGNFIGMVTDSRSLLSYTRHEYFRRILCNLLGGWAETGEVPFDGMDKLAEDISFNNAINFFGF